MNFIAKLKQQGRFSGQQHQQPRGQQRQPHGQQQQHEEQLQDQGQQQQEEEFKEPQHQQRGHGQPPHQGNQFRVVPNSERATLLAWCIAIFCTILWILIILGGIVILIVYLAYRPHSPRFLIQSATLNAAYLDTGILLNADLTILANFTNANRKVNVRFSSIVFDLYYRHTHLARNFVNPFSQSRTDRKLVYLHMLISQVRLPVKDIPQLRKDLLTNNITFEVRGLFRTRSNFGHSFIHYKYWLHSKCSIGLTGPPSGVLISSKCRTKRNAI